MSNGTRLAAVVMVLGIVTGACSSDGDDSASSTSTTVEDDATTTSAATGGDLPDTPLVVSLSGVGDFTGQPVDPSLPTFAPGEVSARFYRAGDVWAAVYDGLSPDDDVCPGNSVAAPDGTFEAVSNSPVTDGACDGAPAGSTILDGSDGDGVMICGDQVGYLTIIPADAEGTLFASMVEFSGPEEGISYVGMAAVDATAPEIDPAVLSC